jgi:MFS family permease
MTLFMLFTVLGVRENLLTVHPPRLHPIAHLRSLWIDPRQHPDFAWVWLTRALVMMGFYSVQPFVQYYLADVIKVPNPAETASYFLGIALIGATLSAYFGGVISDRVGRKKVVYLANGTIAAMTILLIFCRSVEQVIAVGVLFGIGYGAYISVDWALGTDVLPSRKDAAKDMAVWHVSMVLPQSIAPPLTGMLLAAFGTTLTRNPETGATTTHYSLWGYSAMLAFAAVLFTLGAFLLKNVKKSR